MPGIRLHVGIGITSGEVIAGNVGSERRMHYAVVGDSGQRCVSAPDRRRAGPDPRRRADPRRRQRSRRMQDLGSLRLAGKSDWVAPST